MANSPESILIARTDSGGTVFNFYSKSGRLMALATVREDGRAFAEIVRGGKAVVVETLE